MKIALARRISQADGQILREFRHFATVPQISKKNSRNSGKPQPAHTGQQALVLRPPCGALSRPVAPTLPRVAPATLVQPIELAARGAPLAAHTGLASRESRETHPAPTAGPMQVLLHGRAVASTASGPTEIEKEIDRIHRKPRARPTHYTDAKQREEAALEAALDALIPLLPRECYESMLGGALGMAQVVGPRRDAQVRRRLRARPGTNGERIDRARLHLARVRKYAAVELKLPAERSGTRRASRCRPRSPTRSSTSRTCW